MSFTIDFNVDFVGDVAKGTDDIFDGLNKNDMMSATTFNYKISLTAQLHLLNKYPYHFQPTSPSACPSLLSRVDGFDKHMKWRNIVKHQIYEFIHAFERKYVQG